MRRCSNRKEEGNRRSTRVSHHCMDDRLSTPLICIFRFADGGIVEILVPASFVKLGGFVDPFILRHCLIQEKLVRGR